MRCGLERGMGRWFGWNLYHLSIPEHWLDWPGHNRFCVFRYFQSKRGPAKNDFPYDNRNDWVALALALASHSVVGGIADHTDSEYMGCLPARICFSEHIPVYFLDGICTGFVCMGRICESVAFQVHGICRYYCNIHQGVFGRYQRFIQHIYCPILARHWIDRFVDCTNR
jgi:hypothetical protein